MTIENLKIANIRSDLRTSTSWTPASFRGWSYLLDNPAQSLAGERGLPFLACDAADPNGYLDLYKALARGLESLEAELCQAQALRLNPLTYHFTLWDGINQDNIGNLREPERGQYEAFLKGLPEFLAGSLPPSMPPIILSLPQPWSIEFRFKQLSIWSKACALVAEFEPTDAESERSLKLLQQHRRHLDQQFEVLNKPRNREWVAHVSCAYFPSVACAKAAKRFLEGWTRTIAKEVEDQTIRFSSASILAFTSMEKFWQCRLPAVIVSLQEIENARKSKLGHIASRGDQKIMITYQYPKVEQLGQILWTPLAPNGKRHYAISRNIDFAIFDERANQDRHYHRRATEIYRVLDGTMVLQVAGGKYRLVAGDTIIIKPGVIHEVSRDSHFLTQVVSSCSGGLSDKFHTDLWQLPERIEAEPALMIPVAELKATWRQVSGRRCYANRAMSNPELVTFDETTPQERHFNELATKIYSVLDGNMIIDINGAEYSLDPGDTALINAWTVHEVRIRNPFLAQLLILNTSGERDECIVANASSE